MSNDVVGFRNESLFQRNIPVNKRRYRNPFLPPKEEEGKKGESVEDCFFFFFESFGFFLLAFPCKSAELLYTPAKQNCRS
ncbi:hypothetical protein J5N97_016114 [Dioscorea zingiberensis]|uniref:Uncharacterized protein n=1 Tax=Dioscorea zingiberensis TaxID=325984 RepID=A0A9D5HF38_9LILI|nr:hypothetical protein J5N97_016114 [Dioscorea zingiberensis]